MKEGLFLIYINGKFCDATQGLLKPSCLVSGLFFQSVSKFAIIKMHQEGAMAYLQCPK